MKNDRRAMTISKETNLFTLWTPRMSHIRTDKKNVFSPPRKERFPFMPGVAEGRTLGVYQAPPPPPPLKQPPPRREAPVPAEHLFDTAASLRKEAENMELKEVRAPPVSIQLGMLLLSKDDMIKKLLKDWDQKGKGEFMKAEVCVCSGAASRLMLRVSCAPHSPRSCSRHAHSLTHLLAIRPRSSASTCATPASTPTQQTPMSYSIAG